MTKQKKIIVTKWVKFRPIQILEDSEETMRNNDRFSKRNDERFIWKRLKI
jgi:hypothetical protein